MWIRILAAAVLVCLAADAPAHAQIGSMGAGSSAQMFQASQQETPEHRAVEAYNRAARDIKKAEGAKDPGLRRKLYEKAKDNLDRSLALWATFPATPPSAPSAAPPAPPNSVSPPGQ